MHACMLMILTFPASLMASTSLSWSMMLWFLQQSELCFSGHLLSLKQIIIKLARFEVWCTFLCHIYYYKSFLPYFSLLIPCKQLNGVVSFKSLWYIVWINDVETWKLSVNMCMIEIFSFTDRILITAVKIKIEKTFSNSHNLHN